NKCPAFYAWHEGSTTNAAAYPGGCRSDQPPCGTPRLGFESGFRTNLSVAMTIGCPIVNCSGTTFTANGAPERAGGIGTDRDSGDMQALSLEPRESSTD